MVVSGILSPHGPCAALLASVLNGESRLHLDARAFTEYREVLDRPKFALPQGAVHTFLQGLRDLSEWLLPPPLPPDLLPDPDDLPFLELALAAQAVLVTGNQKHFPLRSCRGVEVLSPLQALRRATH